MCTKNVGVFSFDAFYEQDEQSSDCSKSMNGSDRAHLIDLKYEVSLDFLHHLLHSCAFFHLSLFLAQMNKPLEAHCLAETRLNFWLCFAGMSEFSLNVGMLHRCQNIQTWTLKSMLGVLCGCIWASVFRIISMVI